MTFLEGYWQFNEMSEILSMSESELVEVRQTGLLMIAGSVIQMIMRYNQSNRDSDPILFIQACINNPVILNAYAETCATQNRVQITPLAVSYIKLYIRRQVCLSLIRSLTIHQQRQTAVTAAGEKKVLKTEVVCRPREKKAKAAPDAEPITCNVCFDELKPAQLVKTGCDHNFCADCIGSWAKQRGIKSFIQCPCCRTEIDTLTVPNKVVQKKVIKGLA
jgi:hypothetical protein